MSLTPVEESLILATFFRGGRQDDPCWTANTDQILTLSLFYTGDITAEDCIDRFAVRSYVGKLNVPDSEGWGTLTEEIDSRYNALFKLLDEYPGLIEGGGNFGDPPAHPNFNACRLTDAGIELALMLADKFPKKPDFPNWPDQWTMP
ncbi:MAG: hypothetical protein WD065_09370 [Planctomycetaceae bacterium]